MDGHLLRKPCSIAADAGVRHRTVAGPKRCRPGLSGRPHLQWQQQQQEQRPCLRVAAGASNQAPSAERSDSRPGPRPSDIVFQPGKAEVVDMGDYTEDDIWGPPEDGVAEEGPTLVEQLLADEEAGIATPGPPDLGPATPTQDGQLPTVEWTDELSAVHDPAEYITPMEGYTPRDYVGYDRGGPQLTHEVVVEVAAPRDKCYAVFRDRLNWTQWFDLIHRMGIAPDDDRYAEMYCYYQWGRTPPIELNFVLERVEEVHGELVAERSVDFDGEGGGLPISGRLELQDGQQPGTTLATLRLNYTMPDILAEWVGPVGVWGDVNDILEENMQTFKQFVEWVDLDELLAARREDREAYTNFQDPPGADEEAPWAEERRAAYRAQQEQLAQQTQQRAAAAAGGGKAGPGRKKGSGQGGGKRGPAAGGAKKK